MVVLDKQIEPADQLFSRKVEETKAAKGMVDLLPTCFDCPCYAQDWQHIVIKVVKTFDGLFDIADQPSQAIAQPSTQL